MKIFFTLMLASVLLFGCIQQSPDAAPTANPSIDTQESDDAMTDAESMKEVQDTGDVPSENLDPAPTTASELGGGFYEPFTKARYDQAKTEGKIVFLEFYASWCPICATQEPQIEAAFDEITDESIIGFRVNYNDGDTDDDEKNLAREFGVSYQHTHVIVDASGNVKAKSLEYWGKDKVLEEIQKVTA